jgi:hypothetical protein
LIHAGESPSHVNDAVATIRRYSFTVAGAAPGLVLVATKTRTGFPFHSPQLSADAKNSSKAPDNFSADANCRLGEWQLQTPIDLGQRLID